MSLTQGIFWLSSYPKSGNTWFRIVLANALNASQEGLHINRINVTRNASNRALFDEALGFNSYLLSDDELLQLRPMVYTWHSNQSGVQYFKIHDANIRIDETTWLVPSEGSLGAIYLIRNPLDIAISFAHHSHISIDEAINFMSFKQATMYGKGEYIGLQLQQHLMSWSRHVESWTVNNQHISVLCIRYEDMHAAPLATFKKALNFLNLDMTDDAILTAIHHARFEQLQRQEAEQGFREQSSFQKKFFRKGIAGDWKNTLTSGQIKKIIKHHNEVMFNYGYIDEHENPI